MQEVAAQRGAAGDLRGRAVERVAGDGVADAGQVYADLVSAAGADFHFEKREAGQARDDAVFGVRRASVAEARRHAGAVDRDRARSACR